MARYIVRRLLTMLLSMLLVSIMCLAWWRSLRNVARNILGRTLRPNRNLPWPNNWA